MKRTVLVLLLSAGGLVACSDSLTEGPRTTGTETASAEAARFQRWEELRAAGDLEGARAELEAMRSREGSSPELAFRLGVTLEAMDDIAKAVVTYKDELERSPDAGMLWLALGNDYRLLERWAKGRDALLKARELGVLDRHTARSLAICYAQLNDQEHAEAELLKALDVDEDPTGVKYDLAVLRMAQNDYREAKRLLEEVLVDRPQNYEAVREHGNVLIKTTDDPATVAEVQRIAWDVVDHRPTDWRAYMLLGDAFMAADDYEAAVEAYTKALEYSQNHPEVEAKYIEAESNRRRVADQEETAPGARIHLEDFSGEHSR